jgi:hypothetical protein
MERNETAILPNISNDALPSCSLYAGFGARILAQSTALSTATLVVVLSPSSQILW